MLHDDREEQLLSAFDWFQTYWQGNDCFFSGRWFEAKRNTRTHYPPIYPERENKWWKLTEE